MNSMCKNRENKNAIKEVHLKHEIHIISASSSVLIDTWCLQILETNFEIMMILSSWDLYQHQGLYIQSGLQLTC